MKRYLFKVLVLGLLFFAFNLNCQTDIFTVKRVIDGDTIVLANDARVRLLGVDTPELHHPKKPVQCFAREAKAFTVAQTLNQKIKLTFEGANKDRYGRFLAWVWYGPGYKKLLNAEIIRQGYGFSYRKYPTSKLEELTRLEQEARTNKRGLWADNACPNN